MRETLVQIEYFETYYYANIVQNILENTIRHGMDYLRNLNDWHEDDEVELFLQPFPKISVLHEFSYFIIASTMYEQCVNLELDHIVSKPKSQLWVDHALRHYGIFTQGFRNWLQDKGISLDGLTKDHILYYYEDLEVNGEIHKLLTQISNEVFYILFGNRQVLANLNEYISGVVQNLEKSNLEPEHKKLLKKDGVLNRVHIPEWVRKAVFFRDRGMCTCCNKDLSGLITVKTLKHFDHIIPLANGGINDVTNIQLLCEACNLIKGRKPLTTSNKYQAWYT